MFGGECVGVVVYPGVGFGGVGGGGCCGGGVVVGFIYWCGVFHVGFVALWLVFWGLGVVVL